MRAFDSRHVCNGNSVCLPGWKWRELFVEWPHFDYGDNIATYCEWKCAGQSACYSRRVNLSNWCRRSAEELAGWQRFHCSMYFN